MNDQIFNNSRYFYTAGKLYSMFKKNVFLAVLIYPVIAVQSSIREINNMKGEILSLKIDGFEYKKINYTEIIKSNFIFWWIKIRNYENKIHC